jgi:hypothetical protein
MQNPSTSSTVPWEQLSKEQQTQLRIEYGYYIDQLPPTCSLESKIERFRNWLAGRNIVYTPRPRL